jgi:hypothetical protein
MGCGAGIDTRCERDERPQHAVTLSPFAIDRHEATQSDYRRYVVETAAAAPPRVWAPDRQGELPVVNVTWDEAGAYCRWMGGELPTEAQWEYAARGAMSSAAEAAPFSWGAAPVDCAHANVFGCRNRPEAAGGHPLDVSPFGIEDLGGNVREWCRDWYRKDGYARTVERDPLGPPSGSARVVRGGDWRHWGIYARIANRTLETAAPTVRSVTLGFRCVRQPQPSDWDAGVVSDPGPPDLTVPPPLPPDLSGVVTTLPACAGAPLFPPSGGQFSPRGFSNCAIVTLKGTNLACDGVKVAFAETSARIIGLAPDGVGLLVFAPRLPVGTKGLIRVTTPLGSVTSDDLFFEVSESPTTCE